MYCNAGRALKCAAFVAAPGGASKASVLERVSKALSGKRPRAPPSGGDPSALVGGDKRCETEDDVLHIRHLPDFDGRLRARFCELLLQYLTVPYLPRMLNTGGP